MQRNKLAILEFSIANFKNLIYLRVVKFRLLHVIVQYYNPCLGDFETLKSDQ